MCKASVMREAEHRPPKQPAEHVEIGRLGSQRHGGSRERCLAIEARAPQARSSEKMSDGFQVCSNDPLRTKFEDTRAGRRETAPIEDDEHRNMAKRTLANSADKEQIAVRLRKIHASSERHWGRMTAPQMICHLADSFRVTIGEKPWTTARISVTPIPLPCWFVKWVALQTPVPWPRGVETRPEVAAERGGTPPVDFEADRLELERLLTRFTRRPRDFEWRPHPMFGAMADADWMRWGYLHMDHHLRQFGV